eukprot:CAMPEP_0180346874 /NCGR_PEP_ID=MMETSP0989-20121125/4105_1 /TAXON_ID=697907 /ORGANISM="non described non described, Strain CCMP2293" /LENGTH=92 /DNA_ID=CAMNT_0022336033 /DNA_START=375 /DNA_END=649 /DNA_ORIENTATION=-
MTNWREQLQDIRWDEIDWSLVWKGAAIGGGCHRGDNRDDLLGLPEANGAFPANAPSMLNATAALATVQRGSGRAPRGEVPRHYPAALRPRPF